jgi:hypothetical protein
METFAIQTEGPSQTEILKAILKVLDVKVEILPKDFLVQEEIPPYVSKLMNEGLAQADKKVFTTNKDFMNEIKAKYKK